MANIIHELSVQFKRITRSVLARELYRIVHDFNLGAILKITLSKML